MRLPILLSLAVFVAAPAAAATDPDWPCVSPRRDHLSLGQMWAGPPPDAAVEALTGDADVLALAERLADRKTPVEELRPVLADFAGTAGDDRLTAVFLVAFDDLEKRRALVVSRIDDFVLSQRRLREDVARLRARMAELEAAEPADFDAIDQAELELDLAQRAFTERQSQIAYVCEVPNLIEQRIFALSREIGGLID